jgi:glycosyltransferase involved in cell wall biosynthesis
MEAVIIGIDASRLSARVATGTERYTREVIRALLQIAPQHEFHLYVREPLDPQVVLGAEGRTQLRLRVIHIPQVRLWTHIGLAREIAARPPDALFIPAHVLPLPQAIRHATRTVATRTVVTIHDVGYRHFPQAHPWRQRAYLDWSTWLAARFASAVVVDSDATRRDVQRFYHTPDARIAVAYPGPLPLVEVTDAAREAVRALIPALPALAGGAATGEPPYALFIGTLQPRKNLRRLIYAWKMLLEDTCGPKPVLLVAGAKGWGGEDIVGEVASLAVGDYVHFIGYVSDVDKAALLDGARAFVFPSLYEGFGFPVLEAQQAGVPVVCSNTSSLPEVAGDGAVLVDPLDTGALAGALRQVLYNHAARVRLIAAGRRNLSRFSWQHCAAVILRQLENDGMIKSA